VGGGIGLKFFSWREKKLDPLGTSATIWSIVPSPDDR
jgi:hypothetical protein